VLGFAFDGTGYGADGELWGGELLLADVAGFERLAHLQPFRLIGGEQAIREPARQLLGLLLEYYSAEQIRAMQLPALQSLPKAQFANLLNLWRLGRNAPLTSSIGRLFDAIACLLGLIDKPDFEGEAGLVLEAAAADCIPAELHFAIDENGLFSPAPLLAQLLMLRDSVPVGALAAGFIHAIVELILHLARRWPGYPLALCGGVFQNRYLMDLLVPRLQREQRELLLNRVLPPNDGGIAAGQLWYGIHHLQRRFTGTTNPISQES
jgi:hydrogenase maturation protein HypF